ncbi:MAG: FRG domain-containing protein [Thermodesulfobacteriota bacterium]
MSKWQDAYRVYLDMKARSFWTPPVTPGSPEAESYTISYLVRNLGYQSLENGLADLKDSGFPCPESEITKVRQLYRAVDETSRAESPLEDVYQAALSILSDPRFWDEDPEWRVYRGQRKPWSTVPKMFRGNPTNEVLTKKMDQLASFCNVLHAQYPQFRDEYQRIAIAQHYSIEADVETWLVDLTSDPFIALFFASLNGKEGDSGVVTAFLRKEWEELSAGGRNRLGDIKLIRVQGVPRIEAQKALFLNGSHPDLIEQYVAFEIRFRQKCGFIFEDPSREITKDNLLPESDPFRALAVDWKKYPSRLKGSLSVRPPENANQPLRALHYMEIAQSWVEEYSSSLQQPVILSPEARDLLWRVCDFHARLQERREEANITARSLRRLLHAVDFILKSSGEQLPDLKSFVYEGYYNGHLFYDRSSVIKQVLDEMATVGYFGRDDGV